MTRLYLEYKGDSIELPLGAVVIGREVGCALRFNDPLISRRHVRIVRRAAEVFLEDLGSSNGTQLNGRLVVAPTRLRDGDVIVIGNRSFTVRVVGEGQPAVPTTLVVKGKPAYKEDDPLGVFEWDGVTNPIDLEDRTTVNQRCPRCAEPVLDSDADCEGCGYRWGTRPMTPTLNPLDRRRHDRVAVELRMIYSSDELEIEATSMDLSHSGVFVRTEILDPIGTICQLTILIDGGPPVRVKGIVRRVVENNEHGDPPGLGVELIDVGEAERSWINIAVTRITIA